MDNPGSWYLLGKNYLNDEVMVMGKVSFWRRSRQASRRRYPVSRGLKEEELQGTRRIGSLMKLVAHLCLLVTHHLPCKLMGGPQVRVWFACGCL